MKDKMQILKTEYTTKELVEELSNRKAVDKIIAEPYEKYLLKTEKYNVENSGPAIILIIFD